MRRFDSCRGHGSRTCDASSLREGVRAERLEVWSSSPLGDLFLTDLAVAGLLDPRDPQSLCRQRELHAVVHSQLDPRVVEMGPDGGRGYA